MTAVSRLLSRNVLSLTAVTLLMLLLLPNHGTDASSPSSSSQRGSSSSSGSRRGRRLGIFASRMARQVPDSPAPGHDDGAATTTGGGAPVKHMAAGRACSLYVWDAPSALLWRWCNHLQRDCIYEGRGGKKFVRIEPGSMLQLLYPCSRYSTDRCWLCGGTFRDHLTLWWSKHLYTPFDLYVDQVYREGVVLPTAAAAAAKEDASVKKHRKSKTGKFNSYLPQQEQQERTEYAFHRRYVLDLTQLLHGVRDPAQKKKIMQRSMTQRFPRVRDNQYKIEIRRALPYSSNPKEQQQQSAAATHNNNNNNDMDHVGDGGEVSYAVPAVDVRRLGTARRAIALFTVREIFLNAVESTMDLERLDEAREQRRRLQQ